MLNSFLADDDQESILSDQLHDEKIQIDLATFLFRNAVAEI